MSSVNKRNLYENEYNACVLCEYQREIKLLRPLINMVQEPIKRIEIRYFARSACEIIR